MDRKKLYDDNPHIKILAIEIIKAIGAKTAAESILECFIIKILKQLIKRSKTTNNCERKHSNICL